MKNCKTKLTHFYQFVYVFFGMMHSVMKIKRRETLKMITVNAYIHLKMKFQLPEQETVGKI